MKIYLDKPLTSIKVFSDLFTLLQGIITNPELMSQIGDVQDIYKVTHVQDPVREFVEFYLSDGRIEWEEGKIDYVINALYTGKGSVEVLKLFSQLFEVGLEFEYKFPILNLIAFSDIKISNLDLFIQKFTNALYYLLYYTQLNIKIRDLILSVNDNINIFISILNKGYRIHEATVI